METLCDKCKPIDIALLRDTDYLHQPSLAALKASAPNCQFCSLIWRSLTEACSPESIAVHLNGHVYNHEHDTDTAIRLEGELHDIYAGTPETGVNESYINIHSGINGASGLGPGRSGTEVYSKLRLYAKHEDSATQYFPGREIAPRPDADSAITIIRQFVDRCRDFHTCGFQDEVPLPTRVLDLKPMSEGRNPLLVESKGQRGQYVALSYCWGINQTYKTTRETLPAFMATGIDCSKTVQTVVDALKISMLIDVRYIWIDAFCIIQKMEGESQTGDDDFNKEGLKMADYYGNAQLTIVAGSTDDSRKGFLGRRPPPPAQPCRLDYSRPTSDSWSGIKTGHVYAELPISQNIGPIQTRAWTFQEDILSPRMLIFGETQVGYKCKAGEMWESGTCFPARWNQKGLYDVLPRMILEVGNTITPDDRKRMLRQWYIMLQKYTRRQRGSPYDKLTAISGIAQRAQKFIGGRYSFGLWESDMLRGLLWRAGWLPGDPNPSLPMQKIQDFRAPSWSWASVEGPVYSQYYLEREEDAFLKIENTRAKIIDLDSNEAGHFDPIRVGLPIDHFKLHIIGSLKPVMASEGPIADVSNRRSRYWRMRHRMVNLVPWANQEIRSAHGEKMPGIVALALRDTDIELPTKSWCLRLISQEGIWLERLDNGEYRRLGVFLARQMDWFEEGNETEVVVI